MKKLIILLCVIILGCTVTVDIPDISYKVINTGIWNMQENIRKVISITGIETNFEEISIFVYDDYNNAYDYIDNEGEYTIDGNNLVLNHPPYSIFRDEDFSKTELNRGFIVFVYMERSKL